MQRAVVLSRDRTLTDSRLNGPLNATGDNGGSQLWD